MNNKDLIKEVNKLIKEVDTTHRYSMSRIYDLYNKVFDKNEVPQSCASCLIRKVRELNKWLDEQPKEEDVKTTKTENTVKTKRNRNTKA